MALSPKLSDVPRIRGALKLYRVTSIITGTFLLLLVLMMVLRYGFGVDIGFGGNYGGLFLASREAIADAGALNISTVILVVHGWFYVLYLFSDFRVWSLMRWPFSRFLIIASGGIIPVISFPVERHYHRIATAEIDAIEA